MTLKALIKRPLLRLLLLLKLLALVTLFFFMSSLKLTAVYAEGRIAVLEVKVNKHKGVSALNNFEARALTDELRSLALAMGTYEVLTKENITVLLPPDTKLEDCVGSCEVEVGQKLGVSYIITAEAGRISGELDLLIRLYDTRNGSLINQVNLTGQDAKSLREEIKREGRALFSKLALRDVVASKLDTLLFLTVSPAKTQLSIDGKPILLSDLKREGDGYLLPVVPEVKHRLIASRTGYMSAKEEVLIGEGRVETLNINLSKRLKSSERVCEPSKGRRCEADLFVYTTPPGARLYVDGELYQEEGSAQPTLTESDNPDTPNIGMRRLKLTAGAHLIEARIPRYVTAKREVNLSLGDWNKDMEANPMRLTPNFGELRVVTNPPQAIIELDGRIVSQRGSWSDNELQVGAHKLKVSAPLHLPHEQLVLVSRQKSREVNVKLTPAYAHLLIQPRDLDGSAVVGAKVELDQDRRRSATVDREGVVRFKQVEHGKHLVRVTHPLYEPFSLQLEVPTGGQQLRFPINLKARYGLVSVSAAGGVEASAYLSNGRLLGELPLKDVKIPRGRQELRVQPKDAEKYIPVDLSVTLSSRERKDFGDVVLKPRLGEVVINTKPYGGLVSIDGEPRGKAPLKLKLSQGEHTLSVSMREYDTYTQRFRVVEGERVELGANLGQNPTLKVSCSPSEAMVWVNGLPLGPSPQRYSARPKVWYVKCTLGDAEVSKSLRLQMGESRTLTLSISTTQLQNLEAKGALMRKTGWSLLGLSALSAVGGGVSYGVFQQGALDDREASYQRFLVSGPTDEPSAKRALLEADQSAIMWGQVSAGALITSALTGAAGGLLLWLAPEVKTKVKTSDAQTSPRGSVKERARRAQEKMKTGARSAKQR